MTWPAAVGHDRVFDQFQRSLQQGRLASTFLFVGPEGIGKRTTALEIAKALLCETTAANRLEACENCPGCRQVAAGTHPDLILIQKPADRNFIPVETFIGDREHRMREGLCHDIAMKPFRGGRKVAIIDDADYLNQEGANCLLKTLEEPPPGSLIILICRSEQRQLPTIRSRSQIVRFRSLSDEDLLTVLLQQQLFPDRGAAQQAVAQADGSVTRALEMADADLTSFREHLDEQLGLRDFDAVALSKDVQQFVDAAGVDAPPRRARLRQVVSCAATSYRRTMLQLAADPHAEALPAFALSSVAAAECLERCQQALSEVDANANLGTLIPCWLDDVAQRALRV